MFRSRLLKSLLPLLLFSGSAQAQTLSDLEEQAKPLAVWDYKKALLQSQKVNDGLETLIQLDLLQSLSDFHRAGALSLGAPGDNIRHTTRYYQFLLTALSMGDSGSGASLALVWDSLMGCTGRPPRIVARGTEHLSELAPEVIRSVYTSSQKPDGQKEADNTEVQQIVDADQKARGGFSNLTQAQMLELMKEDKARLKRIKEIIASKDGLKTAKDFANAALVCQHGVLFLDYALAHELSVCSLLLGNKDAWLAGASYDRMLLSASYPQRFATQYDGEMTLREFTTEGINDRMRTAVVHKTLEESKARQNTK